MNDMTLMTETLKEAASMGEFKRLRGAIHAVQSWGGVIEASSEIGVGINFRIVFKGFL